VIKITNIFSKYKSLIPYIVWFLFAALLNIIGSKFIGIYFPDRPIVPDLVFSISPYWEWTQYLSDPTFIISIIIFIVVLRKKFTVNFLKEIIISLTLINLLRGLIIPLTPLGRPANPNQPYGIFPFIQNGMFTSGHAGAQFLFYLLVPKTFRSLKITMLFFFIIQVFALLTSRGHYSIDIIGGMMIAYICFGWTNKYLANNQ